VTSLLPGTEVIARGLRWEVVTSDRLGDQTLYRLRCLAGALRAQELDLLSPFETITPVVTDFQTDRAAPLANWLVYHEAFLLEQALGADALLSMQPGRLRVEPYQLVPVLRALKMSRVRLLLADGVGLGKTIQAGLILTELVARRLAHRILVVSPAGPLLKQWHDEMLDKFGLRLEVADRAKLDEIRRGEELGANPFDRLPLALASPDFLKQERVLELLDRASYDVVVLDEAHHYMELAAAGEREDTLRRRLAQTLAARCDSLLLLTATPHDGSDRSFASLCELLDPSLVDGNGALRGERYRPYVVRRLKRHLPGMFREREVQPCAVAVSETTHLNYVGLQKSLLALVVPLLRRAFRERRYADVLSFISLLKRSVSTAKACEETLSVVRERYAAAVARHSEEQDSRRQRLRSLKEYRRRIAAFGAATEEEEADLSAQEAEDIAEQLAALQREIHSAAGRAGRAEDIADKLERLVGLARAAQAEDPKIARVIAEIQSIRREEAQANVLVYTEYVDSLTALAAEIRRVQLGPVLTICGEQRADEMGDEGRVDRKLVTDRFQTEDNLILVSTDASAEGLNLHQRCHHLIHLELPFNPNRLEQRNGRIDRYGQTKDPIVRYLYLSSTFEERILFRLIAKYERQRKRLTFMPNTLGIAPGTDAEAERLLKPMLDEDSKAFSDQGTLFTLEDAATVQASDEPTRELLAEIDKSLEGFERAARTASWFVETGVNAEASLSSEAERARAAGGRSSGVDLTAFVRDAVLLDGGDWREAERDVFEAVLPASWLYGLEDLPGYESGTRRLVLTTDAERIRDSRQRPLGYLGRAHPVVRRALDRVRHLSLGASDATQQDPRVSAVRADVSEPKLLCTFLGRVSSGVGRELERVIAVLIGMDGEAQAFTEAGDWSRLAEPSRAIRTTDLWQRYFAEWGGVARERAQRAASESFAPVASAFTAARAASLQDEVDALQGWLASRLTELSARLPKSDAALSLFDEPGPRGSAQAWRTLPEPIDRLRGMSGDEAVPYAVRQEARASLAMHEQRMRDLNARRQLRAYELVPLGLLMLIPEVSCGA
jgi:ERCC4-related helicase